jgi:hypothetical protein
VSWLSPEAMSRLTAQLYAEAPVAAAPDPNEGEARVWACSRGGRVAADMIRVIAPSRQEAEEYLADLGVGRDVKVIGLIQGWTPDNAHGFAGPFGYEGD